MKTCTKWIPGPGGLRCPHGCCHVGSKRAAKRGANRDARRKVRVALKATEALEDTMI